jgi:uncharacterized protein (DUF362 family)
MKPCMGHSHSMNHSITRRHFLQTAGLAAAGLVAAACQPAGSSPVASSAAKSTVAIAKANSYDRSLIRQQVQSMLDSIGGLSDVLAHGNRVAIKVNLTGGTSAQGLPGIPEIESYLTHPEVVRAVIELFRDAGAKDIYIVEAAYEPESWSAYGYTEMARSVNATIVDLTNAAPYKDFAETTSATNPFIYEKFKFNPILNEIDTFVSVSKMKCHATAGVTHTMKNLFGLVPYRFYTQNAEDKYRSGFHGSSDQTPKRLPGVINDLNRARKVNLSIIDGVWTTEGGEGPWITTLNPIKPNVLFAGKDPVATDSVATIAMGFDPTSDYHAKPFYHAYNHIKMAAELGLGTNKIEEIKVVGASLKEVTKQFAPYPEIPV